MFELSKLAPLRKKRKRVGRGGGRGGTSGKGHKGQKARSGGSVRPGFEGGQMPLYRRLPKRGFTNIPFKEHVEIINLDRLQNYFNEGEIVSKETLINKGLISAKKSKRPFLLKILGNGSLNKKLIIEADLFSESARKAITGSGGKISETKEK